MRREKEKRNQPILIILRIARQPLKSDPLLSTLRKGRGLDPRRSDGMSREIEDSDLCPVPKTCCILMAQPIPRKIPTLPETARDINLQFGRSRSSSRRSFFFLSSFFHFFPFSRPSSCAFNALIPRVMIHSIRDIDTRNSPRSGPG